MNNSHVETRPGNWILVVSSRSIRPTMMAFIARLAERGPLRVLDCSAQFDGYLVSRLLSGKANMRERISLSRVFTCHQMLAALETAETQPVPIIALDFLRTFYNDSVPYLGRRQLLEKCIEQIARLAKPAGGAVSVHPSAAPNLERDALLDILQVSAPECWMQQVPGQVAQSWSPF